MLNLVYCVLRQPAFFLLTIGYITFQYIGIFPVFYLVDLLLIGNLVWFFAENWSNPVFRRTLMHGTSCLSFMIIILGFYGTPARTWVIWVAFVALAVNFTFMVYSSKYNSNEFIKASQIVQFLSRFKSLF